MSKHFVLHDECLFADSLRQAMAHCFGLARSLLCCVLFGAAVGGHMVLNTNQGFAGTAAHPANNTQAEPGSCCFQLHKL